MYYIDYHTHSDCSCDGHVPMRRMAEAASASGLSELCLTDHCDMLTIDGERSLSYDWSRVLAQREELLPLYGEKLALPMGLELGMSHIDVDAAHRILAQPGLDFVIGSVHNRSEAAGGQDFFCGNYKTPDECHEALDNYFTSMETLAPLNTYDALGHIIYPLRYMVARDGQTVSLGRYLGRIRGILRTVVESGHGIELNSWNGKTVDDWLPVLKLYKECGGEIITVGSDAHVPESVGKGISQVYDLLRDTGFRYITVYRARRPLFIKL